MIWDKLLETYENNKYCADIAPIAHTKVKANIGILIDKFVLNFVLNYQMPDILLFILSLLS